MPLDPENPSVPTDAPINAAFLASHQKMSEAMKKQADALAGTSTAPITEGAVYFRLLEAVLMGRLVASANDAQIWATDLTRDYLLKYNLDGSRRTT